MGRCKDCGKWIGNSSQSDGRESLPCFFKVLIGNFSKKLWIPPRFAGYLITGGATLRGPSGNIWNVRLKRKDNRFFFGKGWENFARHHQLNTADFLIFSYCGVLEFNVLIFDRSGCLREDAFFAENLENADENGEQNKRQDAGESSVEVIAQPRAANNGTSKESPVDCISVESRETSSQQKQGKLSKCSSKVIPKPDEAAEVCWQKQTGTSSLSKRRRATTEEKSRSLMLASSFHSRHPFFISRMLRSFVSDPFKLQIPSQFAKAHLVRKKTKVILRNAMTGEWSVTCLHNGKQGLKLSAGWPAFVHAHSLVEGDVCVFELLDKERLVMNVTIYRIAHETVLPCAGDS